MTHEELVEAVARRVSEEVVEQYGVHYCEWNDAKDVAENLDCAAIARAVIALIAEQTKEGVIASLTLEEAKRIVINKKFDSMIDHLADGCWQWTGSIDRKGYGHFYAGDGITRTSHQFSYIRANGTVPQGMVIDHVCRNRACVNPNHLRAITNAENVLIGEGPTAKHARKTICHIGHPLTEDNVYVLPNGGRECRECRKLARQRFRNRRSGIEKQS